MRESFDGFESGPADARSSVIWLHGLGADCWDFAPIVPELGLEGRSVRFVFPNAPVRRVTLNGGAPMRAWYDLRNLDMDGRSHDEAGIEQSLERVGQLVEREGARGVAPGRIVLAGFSQGGAIALLAALRHPQRLAGLVGLSCYLLFADRVAALRSDAAHGLPTFLAHGTSDPIVPLAGGEHARDRAKELGLAVEWHTYAMPHAVHPREITDIGAFLARVLPE